jgi:hypothetical protein
MELPAGHEGAPNDATRGLAVDTTAGVLPLTNGVTWKLFVSELVWPEPKSLVTTWI